MSFNVITVLLSSLTRYFGFNSFTFLDLLFLAICINFSDNEPRVQRVVFICFA